MPASILINGISYSWANIKLVLFGIPVVGITAINYKRKQKKENNYGSGTRPVSRGFGNEEYEGSITLYMEEWKKIIAASPSNNPLLIPRFDVPVVFSGNGVAYTTDILKSVEFMEDNMPAGQGDTKILVTVPLIIGDIQR